MRTLLAVSDRDLLESLKKLLDASLGETVTAFDGAQVLSHLPVGTAYNSAQNPSHLPVGTAYNSAQNPSHLPTETDSNGALVLAHLPTDSGFDVAVLDKELSRISHDTLVAAMRRCHLPVIVLLDRPVTAAQLLEEPLANAYLPHPFSLDRLLAVIRDVVSMAKTALHFQVAGQEVDVGDFRFENGPCLTAKEIHLLQSFSAGGLVRTACPEISSLNGKLDKLRSPFLIRYIPGKGFELVNSYA